MDRYLSIKPRKTPLMPAAASKPPGGRPAIYQDPESLGHYTTKNGVIFYVHKGGAVVATGDAPCAICGIIHTA
eukprot:762539-Hanusia_phi.AAC.3